MLIWYQEQKHWKSKVKQDLLKLFIKLIGGSVRSGDKRFDDIETQSGHCLGGMTRILNQAGLQRQDVLLLPGRLCVQQAELASRCSRCCQEYDVET